MIAVSGAAPWLGRRLKAAALDLRRHIVASRGGTQRIREDTECICARGYGGSVPRSRPSLPIPLAVALGVGVAAVLVVALLTARLDQSINADQKACQAVLPLVDHTQDLLGQVTDRDADPYAQESARASLVALSEEVRANASFVGHSFSQMRSRTWLRLRQRAPRQPLRIPWRSQGFRPGLLTS